MMEPALPNILVMMADDHAHCLMRWPEKLPAKRQPSMPFDHCDLSIDPRETFNRIDDPLWQGEIASLGNRLDEHFQRFEDPQRSGKNILAQPLCNASALWRP